MRICLLPYDSRWPDHFRREAERLSDLSRTGWRIEHIGSTAVPGLAAKPVIDVLLGAPDRASLDALPGRFSAHSDLLYVPKFEDILPFRRFFIRLHADAGRASDGTYPNAAAIPYTNRAAHLHAVPAGHVFFDEHLRFRDRLRTDADLRELYGRLKSELAAREWRDGTEYAEAKSDFIRKALDG